MARGFADQRVLEPVQPGEGAVGEQGGEVGLARGGGEAGVVGRGQYHHRVLAAQGHALRALRAGAADEVAEVRFGVLQLPGGQGGWGEGGVICVHGRSLTSLVRLGGWVGGCKGERREVLSEADPNPGKSNIVPSILCHR